MRISRTASVGTGGPGRPGGFTLLELLVVVAIVALAAAVTSLALPDPRHTRLEREAARLVHLLESARAHARAAGLPVTWAPGPAGGSAAQGTVETPDGGDFHFSGLPASADLPRRWLETAGSGENPIRIELLPARAAVALGPEPVIESQRILLSLDEHRVLLATDGLAPFAVQHTAAAATADAR